jgi:hypothetical protein
MNSLERQRRLTKLLAMVQTVRISVWALSIAAHAEQEPGDTDLIIGELIEADGILLDASKTLTNSLRREIAAP